MAIALRGAVRHRRMQDGRVITRLASRVRRCLAGAADRWVWTWAIVGLVAIVASRTASDADWDLRNYHLYNAHALITGRFWTDIAAAQMQTFLSPLMDIAIGAIRDRLNATPVLCNAALSIPHGVAAALAFRLTLRVIPGELPGRAPLALVAALYGAAGAAGYPTLAAAMNEMLPGCCILAGLLLLTDEAMTPRRSAALAGVLFGIAAGLKLTFASYCVAASVALLATPGRPLLPTGRALRMPSVAWFALAGLAAAALVGGPWWLVLYRHFGNPILPFMNHVFHSPFVDPRPFTDDRFLPKGPAMILAFPFYWAAQARAVAGELPMRDPRFAIAFVAVASLAARALRLPSGGDGSSRAGTLLVLFFAISFAVWEAQFAILRYLAVLELLSGAVVLVALQPLLIRPGARVPVALGFVALCAVAQAMTVYPNWGRMEGTPPMRTRLPALEANAMVVLLDPSPMAYLADLLPPSVRFVGANNNLIRPGGDALLARTAETAIRSHTGPIYGLEDPVESPGAADWTLMYFRLRRGNCSLVESNLDNNAIHLCRLWPASG
jgi:hypothetical protein